MWVAERRLNVNGAWETFIRRTTRLRLRRESLSKLAVHVNIASQLNAAVDSMKLAELSALEQSLVFGEAGTKELIAYLTTAAGMTGCSPLDKLRLLFIFTCMHPDKVRSHAMQSAAHHQARQLLHGGEWTS